MNRWPWLLAIAAAAGCINGAPLPPTPVSSVAVPAGTSNGDVQESEYVQMVQTYLRGQGKDPTQATYSVRRTPRHEEEATGDEPTTAAVVRVNFLDGNVWHVAITTDGDMNRITNR